MSFFFLTEIYLVYNITLVSSVEQSDSVIHMYTHTHTYTTHIYTHKYIYIWGFLGSSSGKESTCNV